MPGLYPSQHLSVIRALELSTDINKTSDSPGGLMQTKHHPQPGGLCSPGVWPLRMALVFHFVSTPARLLSFHSAYLGTPSPFPLAMELRLRL
jgi:hypothetical protein